MAKEGLAVVILVYILGLIEYKWDNSRYNLGKDRDRMEKQINEIEDYHYQYLSTEDSLRRELNK